MMPGGDRTGPLGRGPMTGRGAGYCSGFDMPEWSNPAGAGYRGRNRFFPMMGRRGAFSGRRFVPFSGYREFQSSETNDLYQKALLEEELKALEAEKTWISKRIGQLESVLNEDGSEQES